MGRGARRRIRRGIYADPSGYATVVTVHGLRKEKRWPHGTPLGMLERWVDDTRHAFNHGIPKTPRGSIGADARRYERVIRDLVSFKSRRSEIRAWVIALHPGTHRSRVTHEDIRRVRGDWLEAHVAPKTINNRVFALLHLYKTLDGRSVPTPCDEIEPLPVHRRPAVRVEDGLIRRIYQDLIAGERTGRLANAKTRARFAVFASTGKRPSEIGRAEPADVDLKRRVWTPRDGKGGFCPGVVLNDDMLEAWKLFAKANAWGKFDTSSFGKRMRTAGLPKNLDPYQLRHTVGLALSEAGFDLRDIADHLGHKSTQTTRAHYVPVLNSRLSKVSEQLGTRKLGFKADD